MSSTRFSFDLVANVGRFRRGFRQADTAVRGFGNRLGFLRSRLTQVTGALAAFFGGRQLVRGFRAIVSEASDLETQMARVRAVSGATEQEMARLRETAISMGESTTFTAVQSAEAMENLARAGLTATEQIEAIPQVLQFAEANSLELAEAASIVTSAVNGMNMEFADSQRVTDVLTKAAQNADASVQDLGQSLSFAAPTASALGLEIEQTTALLGSLADAGLDGSRAGTALNQVLVQFTDSTSRFRRELREAGIETDDFGEMLRELERAGPRAGAAINALGTRGGPALRILLSEGSESIEAFTRQLGNAEGASAEAAETMRDTLSGSISLLQSAWNTLKRELGDPILSRVRQGVDDLADGIRDFVNSDNLGRLQRALVETWDSGSAAVRQFVREIDIADAVGSAADSVRGLARAFSVAANSIGVVSNLIAGVFNTLRTFVGGIATTITGFVAGFMAAVERIATGLNAIGQLSDATLQRIRISAEGAQAAWDETARFTRESMEAIWENSRKGGQHLERLIVGHENVAAAASENADATADLGNTAAGAASQIETLDETLDRTTDAASRATDQIQTLDETLAGLGQGGEGGMAKPIADANVEIETLDESLDGLPKKHKASGDAAQKAGRDTEQAARDVGEAATKAADDAAQAAETSIGAATSAVGAVSVALRAKYAEVSDAAERAFERMQERAVGTGATVQAFFRRMADGRDRLDQQIARETEQLQRMQAQIERSTHSTEDLSRIARMSVRNFELLGDEQLEPVRRAIADAQRRLESMRASAVGTLQSLQEELLQVQGREEELAQMRRQRRREDLQEQIAEAEGAGDAETVSTLREALRTLDQIGRAEQQQRREEAEQQRRQEQEQKREADRQGKQQKQEDEVARERERRRERDREPSRTVRITLGGSSIDVPEGQAQGFIDEMERLGARTP